MDRGINRDDPASLLQGNGMLFTAPAIRALIQIVVGQLPEKKHPACISMGSIRMQITSVLARRHAPIGYRFK